jgi:hypothetical protein
MSGDRAGFDAGNTLAGGLIAGKGQEDGHLRHENLHGLGDAWAIQFFSISIFFDPLTTWNDASVSISDSLTL